MHSRSWSVVAMLVLLVNSAPALAQPEDQLKSLKQEAVTEVESLRKFTQQAVDQIFSFGELGFQEFETSSYVTGILRDNGFEVEQGVAEMPTAWIATWGSGKPIIGQECAIPPQYWSSWLPPPPLYSQSRIIL